MSSLTLGMFTMLPRITTLAQCVVRHVSETIENSRTRWDHEFSAFQFQY